MTTLIPLSEAQILAATLPGLEAFLAKDSASQNMLLLLATADINNRKYYQGSKFDPAQEHEFPRVDGPPAGPNWPADRLPAGMAFPWADMWAAAGSVTIWDWDPAANDGKGAAVVPDVVKISLLYQANWIAQPKYYKRLEAIKSGLSGQSIGTAQETFADKGGPSMALGDGLCERASQLLDKYRLRSGNIL